MKSQKPLIKIIKRGERESLSTPAAAPRADKADEAADFTRRADSTVAGWVREFQRRRLDERKDALTNLREARALLPQEGEPSLTTAGA
ncbi:MAG TPA: hypothetical protein VGC89_04920 [Pyrinomonadaceae bacterium]|jgi:hypothetical protein